VARILFGSMPNTGHVRPGLPLVRELISAGHEVTWYTGSSYGSAIQDAGATFVPMSPDRDFDDDKLMRLAQESGREPGLPRLKFDLLNFFIKPVPQWVEEVDGIAGRLDPDVVVVEHAFLAGLLVAEKRQIPSVAFSTTPLVLASDDTAPFGTGLAPSTSKAGRARNRAMNWSFKHVVFAEQQKAANGVRRQVGLPPRDSVFFNWNFELASRYLAATIPEFEYPRSDLPPQVRFTGAMLPAAASDWVPPAWWADVADSRQRGRPVIVVTQGTTATEVHKLLLPAIRGLSGLDALVIGTTAGADPESILPTSRRPANLRLERFIPFANLLPHVDLMVTNGGYGGTQQALAHGVPLVAAGRTEDKMEVSARVAWSGAGISLRVDAPTDDQVAQGVRRVLSQPRYRARARELAESYERLPGVPTAAAAITEVAAGARA
jgi:MGT family glycosyltransferase